MRQDGQVAHCSSLPIYDELVVDLGVPPRGEGVVDRAAPPRAVFEEIKVAILEEGPRLVRERRRESGLEVVRQDDGGVRGRCGG